MSDLPEFVYCISHEEMVRLERGTCVGHTYTVQTEFGAELEMCCLELGYALTPPPASLFSDTLDYVKSEDWKNWCEENQPDYDELLISDLQAVSLMEELR